MNRKLPRQSLGSSNMAWGKIAPAVLWVLVTTSSFAHAHTREIEFINDCNQPLKVHIQGADTHKACDGGSNSCPPGFRCQHQTKTCVFHLAPGGSSEQGWVLQPNEKRVVEVPKNHFGGNVRFSGAVFATPQPVMEDSHYKCETSAAHGPHTRAEMTLTDRSPDHYDISLIHGFNLPIEMKPRAGDHYATMNSAAGANADYFCGNAGAVRASSPALSGCSWHFRLEHNENKLLWVTPLENAANKPLQYCSTSEECPGDLECGTSEIDGKLQRICGNIIGIWSHHQLCVRNPHNPNDPLLTNHCEATQSMLACDKDYSVSCYSPGAAHSGKCCGCPDWTSLLGVNVPVVGHCLGTDKAWEASAIPLLKFLKAACPTAYTFPYDDKTSTFSCKGSGREGDTGENLASYTISFCPNGVLPKWSTVKGRMIEKQPFELFVNSDELKLQEEERERARLENIRKERERKAEEERQRLAEEERRQEEQKEKERAKKEAEQREREAIEEKEREARENREKEAREEQEREAREKQEREAREKQEREAREKQDREAKEKQEIEAKDKETVSPEATQGEDVLESKAVSQTSEEAEYERIAEVKLELLERVKAKYLEQEAAKSAARPGTIVGRSDPTTKGPAGDSDNHEQDGRIDSGSAETMSVPWLHIAFLLLASALLT